jgi:hypothetical protein
MDRQGPNVQHGVIAQTKPPPAAQVQAGEVDVLDPEGGGGRRLSRVTVEPLVPGQVGARGTERAGDQLAVLFGDEMEVGGAGQESRLRGVGEPDDGSTS